jgi:hypothetical protein
MPDDTSPCLIVKLGPLRRRLVLAALLGSLVGCAAAEKSPPPSAEQQVAAAPAPAVVERPPVPKRKPAPPGFSSPAAAVPDTAAVEPGRQVEPEVAALESVRSTPEVPNDLVGLDSIVIERDLGPPTSRHDVPPAVVWQYANDACGLDVWLYRDLQSGALRALFVEVKGDDRTEQRRQSCIKQLTLQSAGGARRDDADKVAPR